VKRSVILMAVAVALSLLVGPVSADVRPHALFGDHMVLQRDKPIRIYGRADAGEKVSVRLGDESGEAVAGADGAWAVELKALPAGGPYTLTLSGKNVVEFKDVLVGDVWVCGGQSNMTIRVGVKNAEKLPGAKEKIRLFRVEGRQLADPQEECGGTWETSTPEAIAAFSCVGYFFGANLQAELGIPVGLINNAVGGTTNQEWLPHDAYAQTDEGKKFLAKWDAQMEANRKAWSEFAEVKAAYEKAKEAGDKNAVKPGSPKGFCPMTRYNGWTHPLIRFPIKGFAWYQGEWNSGSINGSGPAEYDKFLPLTIEWYRKLWNDPDMPFLIVQLPNYGNGKTRSDTPLFTGWPNSQEVQLKTWLKTPHTGLAVTVDIGGALHPGNKDIVGRRLALAALKVVYGRDLVYSGPIYKSMAVEGDKVRVTFEHVGGGLVARDPETKVEGGPLKGFALAGEDQEFHAAQAAIEGDSVVVSCAAVPKPVAVRYAFHQNPQCDLYNREGLPASPFRSDDWPMPGKRRGRPAPAAPAAAAPAPEAPHE
jgi:sialate O-acetylesterase